MEHTLTLTTDELKAINFALGFAYWLHSAKMNAPKDLDALQLRFAKAIGEDVE